MQKDPRKRPGAANLLTHPWITAERIPIPGNAVVPVALTLEEMFIAVQDEEESEVREGGGGGEEGRIELIGLIITIVITNNNQ